MSKISKYRLLIAGMLSPVMAAVLGMLVYVTLTRASADLNQDFIFRLTMVTLAMVVPFALTVGIALAERRRHALTLAGKM